MKIITRHALWSPLPDFDHLAYDDNVFPDGPVGNGATPLAALRNLLEQVDHDEVTEAAVQAEIDKLTQVAA